MQQTPIQVDGRHDCKGVRFDPQSLDIISDIVSRLRRGGSGDCLCPQKDWVTEIRGHEPIQHSYDSARAKQDMTEARRIESLANPLKLATDVLRKIQECVSAQVRDCKSQVRALRMRAGFAALPDEILTTTLEYALIEDSGVDIYDEHGPYILQVFRAIGRLSLACRRFRYLLTHFSHVWCRLWSGMGAKLVSSLCKRLERDVAEILIARQTRFYVGTQLRPFVDAVIPHAELWRRFTFSHHPANVVSQDKELHFVASSTHRLHVPSLTHLTIEYASGTFLNDIKEDDEHYFFSSWSTPTLTSLTVGDLIPYSLAASSTLTSFGIHLHWPRVSERTPDIFKALALFLASCSNLVKFTVHLESLHSTSTNVINCQPVIFPSVENLDLDFDGCEAPLIKSFFDVVQFPKASSISLCISRMRDDLPAQDVLDAVLCPRPTRNSSFTLLRSLYLELNAYTPQDVTFPYASLRNLEHLTLSLDNVFFDDSPFPLDSEPCLPSLRWLTFNSCRALNRSWVRGLLERLKRQGNIPQLSAHDCRWREGDEDMSELSDLSEPTSKDDANASSSAGGDDASSWDERSDEDEDPAVVTESGLISMVS